jgi:hypothetical protein
MASYLQETSPVKKIGHESRENCPYLVICTLQKIFHLCIPKKI